MRARNASIGAPTYIKDTCQMRGLAAEAITHVDDALSVGESGDVEYGGSPVDQTSYTSRSGRPG